MLILKKIPTRSLVAATLTVGVALGSFVVATAQVRAPQAVSGPARACPPPATPVASAPAQTTAADPITTGSIAPTPGRDPYRTRIVVVEWKISKGRECDFLNYWSTRSTIPNRAGLIGEFLSEVDARPWVNWTLGENWTTYYNVGIWRDAADFDDQIGKHIDNSRPPLEFEAAKRQRVFLAPERWRIGATALPAGDPDGVR
jgi:hypothetical protein